jgi:hypothetical protein
VRFLGATVVGVGLLLTGCGYTAQSRLPEGITTIAVPVFRNQTLRKDIDRELAQALRKEIRAKTSLKIVDIKDRAAQSVLEGEILELHLSKLREDDADQVIEYRLSLQADVSLRDLRTDTVIRSEKNLSRNAEFLVSKGETIGQAREEAVRELAREIVGRVLTRW